MMANLWLASALWVGLALAYFFGRTDLGLATLASSQEPTASRLVGIRLNRVSMLTWGTAGTLGGLAGVLLAPVLSTFHAGFGTTDVLIPAFTGAVLGGMTSVPGAFVGSLMVGVVRLPNVPMSYGVRSVSAMSTLMLAIGARSSSATA